MWPFSTGAYPTRTPESVASKTYDYIVVGGGTAGCVLASLLSKNPVVSVLLLERGPVVDTWESRVPLISASYLRPSTPKYGWLSTPLTAAPGTPPVELASGKALGGSSKINATVYTRSVPGDYNAWEAAGRKGWGWKDVGPHFIGIESALSHDSPRRGHQGPWKLRLIKPLYFKSTTVVTNTASALGLPFSKDANDPTSPPTSMFFADTIVNEAGQRQSTFEAFLPRSVGLERQGNLFICPQVAVSKIDLQASQSGTRAVGVYFQREPVDGESSSTVQLYASARQEIILCAGAIASPQVLMLSGIGPADHLRSHNIPVVQDLPGVGSNLEDHVAVPLVYQAPPLDTFYRLERSRLFAWKELLKYILFKKGVLLTPNPFVFVFASSEHLDQHSRTILPDATASDAHLPANVPDIEIMYVAYSSSTKIRKLSENEGAISFNCTLLKPESKGTLRLESVDPCARPLCDIAYLADARDYLPLRKVVRLGLAIGREMQEGGYPLGSIALPTGDSDEDLDDFIRKGVQTTYHYSGTCRMGPEKEGGVVDDELSVHGVEGLRVADASIFPNIPAAHLQAPIAMVASRCAEFIARTNPALHRAG